MDYDTDKDYADKNWLKFEPVTIARVLDAIVLAIIGGFVLGALLSSARLA